METVAREKSAASIVYELLPPPLAALPAKYHTPLSLAIHSLTTGMISKSIIELAGLNSYSELALLLGVTHDIHQKLVEDGLSTLKTAKRYLREKLDELGYEEYWRHIDNALEMDACGKGTPVPGLPRELAVACHIGDMAQGRLEGASLLYWLRENIKQVSRDLTVKFYSIMIPQPYARAYAILTIYSNHIAPLEHVALASPWGLYVIAREGVLPDVLDVSWDELRIDPIIDIEDILDLEERKAPGKIGGIIISEDEAKNRLWSRFARMFYKVEELRPDLDPIYPRLPQEAEGLFVNIRFTDVEFVELRPEETFICGLCGMPHHKDDSLPIVMYGTKKGIKISGVRVTPEKWNRFLPAHLKVKTWDSRGPWRHGIGMCPLCALDAVAIREIEAEEGRRAIEGYLTLSISKPLPVGLLRLLGDYLRERRNIHDSIRRLAGTGHGVVLDFSTATAATSDVPRPVTENMFGRRELRSIGALLSYGLYPLKYLPGLDTSIPDRLLTTTITFQALDFPVTSKKYSRLIPWVVKLVEAAGSRERSEGLPPLTDRPEHAPLHLLSLDKQEYDYVSSLLRMVGVRV